MTDQFSVIRNDQISSAQTPAVRRVETGDARKLIVGRQFMVLGDEVSDAAHLVNPHNSGIFLPGAHAHTRARRIKAQYPGTPVIIEPYSVGHYKASADRPFEIPQEEDALFQMTLDDVLDGQRASYSDLALTPTGQVAKGDSRTLKAALETVNELEREDVLFVLPLLSGWLDDKQLCQQIVAVINRSRHPVALAFVSTSNPVQSLKRLKAYRGIMQQVTQMVVAYRVDLLGFEARAHGAVASATGPLPSRRRVTTAGKGGQASDPTDLAPHMLLGDMLRFARSKHMRQDWFVDSDSITCNCIICDGLPIDRLYENDADRMIGHLHNVVELGRLHDMTVGLEGAELLAWWTRMAKGAADIYPRLSTYLDKNVPVPVDVGLWSGQ